MSDNFSFSTRPFVESERFGRYHEIYKFNADAVALESTVEVPIEVDARGWLWGELVCTERRVKGLGSERAARRVRRDQSDHFCLHLNVQGDFHGDGEGGYQAVRPGEILVLDMAKPERAVTANTRFVTLAVPRAVLASARVETDRLHGLIIPARHAVRLAGALMSAIAQVSRPAAETADQPADAPPHVVYGFGWYLDPYHGHARNYHDGETIGFRSTIQRFPRDNATVVVLCNRTDLNPESLSLKVADVLFATTGR